MAEAAEGLMAALDELQSLGFEVSQVAELLDVDAAELSGSGTNRRVGKSRLRCPVKRLTRPHLRIFPRRIRPNKVVVRGPSGLSVWYLNGARSRLYRTHVALSDPN